MGNAVREYEREMRIANLADPTITARLAVLRRLATHLDDPTLLSATAAQLRGYQARFELLAPASANIYTRHIQAYYRWCLRRELLTADPSAALIVPRVRPGRPHPTLDDDVRLLFCATRGVLRIAYLLAAFMGLRCAEICQLQRHDLLIDDQAGALAHVFGKGGKWRTVPMIPAVIAELREYGLPRAGHVLLHNGRAVRSGRLSNLSTVHMQALGIESTLHGLRHYFLTHAARLTHDPLFVRDLAGHASVATTEIYMENTMALAHQRLAGMNDLALGYLGEQHQLRAG